MGNQRVHNAKNQVAVKQELNFVAACSRKAPSGFPKHELLRRANDTKQDDAEPAGSSSRIDFSSIPIFPDGSSSARPNAARFSVYARGKNLTQSHTKPVLKNTPPPGLPRDTPAWSERGKVGLGPAFFQVDQRKQSEILTHESIHAAHQTSATEDNSHASREHAEALASGTRMAFAESVFAPAPGLLAFPVQTHKPWDQVYIGNSMIIGELKQGGLTLRIKMEYSEFGVDDIMKYDKSLDMDLIDTPKPTVYHCGTHPNKNLVDKVKKLRAVLSTVEQLNKKIPTASTFSIQFIFVSQAATERYRTANKKGILFLSSKTLDTGIADAAAHEASHGIFEHHATAGDTDPAKRVPDNLALQVADIFIKLGNTKTAALPDKKFNPKAPPPYTSTTGGSMPAGIIPVHDTVWSGEGGHPGSDVDEFFASAFAAHHQDPKLLNTIVNYYNKHDSSIKPLYKQLFDLFKKVGSAKSLKTVPAPTDQKAAETSVGRISPPPDYSDPARQSVSDQSFFDPTSLRGPNSIHCKP